MHVLVMAKEPVPGRVKTRLCPPCTPHQAAELAGAALADTLDAVAACGADRRILALDGRTGAWLPDGFEVIDQRGPDFAARLARAWADADGPGFQIGMDTPQVTGALLDQALHALSQRTPAVIGRAPDGGWWGIGFQAGAPAGVFDGVEMSTSRTAEQQIARCRAFGLDVTYLPELRDVDTWDDALAVGAEAPTSRFAAALGEVSSTASGAWTAGATTRGRARRA